MDELLSEFLTETSESLATLDVELVRLEQNPNDPELLQNIFRLVHTIKGTCGFLGLPRLETVAHASENVLGKIRDKEIEVTPEAVTVILESLDRIKEILAALETQQAEPEGTDEDLIARLDIVANGGVLDDDGAPAAAPEAEGDIDVMDADAADATEQTADLVDAASEAEDLSGGDIAHPVEHEPEHEAAPEPEHEPAPAPVQESREVAPAAETAPVPTAKSDGAKKKSSGAPEPSVAAQTIRVSVDLLENLMTMVSELVLTRNQLLQMVRGKTDSEFTVPLQRLSHVTSELQEGVMKTRMQPIGNAWAKLPRIIRDIGRELGKKIDLKMIGADTELDRQVLEMIKDPLTHMVRNSADHGLETPDERRAAGKPEAGTVLLNAYHEGGHIIIEITDDGRGIDIERVKQKAVANGMLTEAEAETISDQQAAQLIFRAGLSTAEKVTNVSGRGVGMDVVKTNIEKIGGNVELKTVRGKGSTFIIKIPLTLAIVSALIVQSAASASPFRRSVSSNSSARPIIPNTRSSASTACRCCACAIICCR